MSDGNPVTHPAPVEMLMEWEGPAVYAPGALFEEGEVAQQATDANTAALAAWVSVTALSSTTGNPAYEAIKQKVLGVLAAWRRRFGQAKIDEVKQQLFLQMQQHRRNARITDEELRERIERLFAEIQA